MIHVAAQALGLMLCVLAGGLSARDRLGCTCCSLPLIKHMTLLPSKPILSTTIKCVICGVYIVSGFATCAFEPVL